jgi:hypothetical protein
LTNQRIRLWLVKVKRKWLVKYIYADAKYS